MKKITTFLLFFIASYSFSQSVNDYKAVIVPMKYGFLKGENEYRLNTLTKFNLQKAGFVAFYNNEAIPNEYNDRCSLLYLDVKKESGFLITKLLITFSDCKGAVVYQSAIGKSKEKDYQVSYSEALNNAFQSVYDLQYKYNGTNPVQEKKTEAVAAVNAGNSQQLAPVENAPIGSSILTTETISNGYLLIDSQSSKVVLKVLKTSNEAVFIAQSKTKNGVVLRKGDELIFEYYENDKLVLEKLNAKF
jgi:hypothetical protein